MFRLALTITASIIFCEAININLNKCYSPKHDFYPYFSARTAYQFVRGNITRPRHDCKPLQIWMMSRHGARYPTLEVIKKVVNLTRIRDEIVKNHENGAGELCSTDLEKLHKWELNTNVSEENAGILAPQGEHDVKSLAQRLRTLFPDILHSNNIHDYSFTSTITDRSTESLKTFIFGLTGSNSGLDMDWSNSSLMMPHAECSTWIKNFNPKQVYTERDKFTTGQEVQRVLENVSKRLGFSKIVNFSTVRSMYEICRLETAWKPNELSTWCTLFAKEELIVLEYREDLDYYYCCGPGRDVNAKLNCPIVRDMFERFQQIENGKIDDQPKGVFYFGHTTNIQSVSSVFHLGEDPTPLLASNFESSKNRLFRASRIGPFSANLISVLYKCDDKDAPYKVTLHLNENPVKMGGCNDGGLCDWQFLKKKFLPEVSDCNLDFCHDDSSKDTNDEFSFEQWVQTVFRGSDNFDSNNATYNSSA